MVRSLVLIIRILRRLGWVEPRLLILSLSEVFGIDLLTAAHHERGIGKFATPMLSGEQFLIERVLPRLLRQEPVMLDVGANRGDYTKALKSAFPNAEIFAFEPDPVSFADLTQRFGSGVSLHNMAIGDAKGSVKLFVPQNSSPQSAHASIYRDVPLKLHHYNVVTEVITELGTLDDFLNERGIAKVDFLKIDVEGHELAVLRGLQQYLVERRVDVIQFEFNEMNLISRVYLRDFIDLLTEHAIFRIDTTKLLPLHYSPREEIFQFQNFVAIPEVLCDKLEPSWIR